MDTSKEYIKMCNCKEIQGLWKVKEGDFVSHKERYDPGVLLIIDFLVEKLIWLPRQDQLQEMCINGGWVLEFAKLYSFITPRFKTQEDVEKWADYMEYFKSWEQLWLAFMMSEKYNKVWNKNKWIKKEKK